ncbi:MAG: helix-turn-helix transcriptional regulator [Pseudonocardia sp.]|nr:helix-turn-helix transcriptional regulator [Pseudonocardia sp.]
MARPENPLNPQDGPLAEFACQLRAVRRDNGNPSYRALAQRAHFSSTTLSEAARGARQPSLEVTVAFVRSCGADATDWTERWHRLDAHLRSVPSPTDKVERRPGAPGSATPSGTAVLAGFGVWRTAIPVVVLLVFTMAISAATAFVVALSVLM